MTLQVGPVPRVYFPGVLLRPLFFMAAVLDIPRFAPPPKCLPNLAKKCSEYRSNTVVIRRKKEMNGRFPSFCSPLGRRRGEK